MHTNLDNIEKLLEKYFEATATLQEEHLLKNYFTSDKVAPHLQEYKYLFQYFKKSKEERLTKEIRLRTLPQKRKWIGIAASIVLLLGVFIGFNKYKSNSETKRAYADTKKALELIAMHMNKGNNAIGQLDTYNETKHKIFK